MYLKQLVWLVYLLMWTTLLLVPIPQWIHPDDSAPMLPFLQHVPFDKIVHTAGYVLLGALSVLAFPQSPSKWLVLGMCLIHGAFTELLQHASGYRTGSVPDWLADFLGVALVSIFVFTSRKKQTE